jgi:signal transduction histidine kinase/ligand-binding sensor domain-containing protein/AraC-like DNA-binding protein
MYRSSIKQLTDMKKSLLMLLLVVSGNLFSTNVRFYDSRQLTCNLITSICQDTEGYIWIGTDYGLNRFNGIQFAHYYNAVDDSASLLHNSVHCLMLDRNGMLWIGCINGLQYYLPDEDCFQQISFGDTIVPHITGIAQFRSGEIWVATSGFGIYCVDLKQKKTNRIDNIPHITDWQFFNYVYEDSRGVQWFGISEVGLLQYNPATGKSKLFTRDDLPGGSIISGMIEDKQGQLLVSTSTAVNLYNRETDRFRTIASDEDWIPARQLISTTEGQVYLATYGKGINRINDHTNGTYSVSAFDTEAWNNPYINIRKAKIATICEDHNRNLWIGCYQKGLLMLPNEVSPFKKWTLPAGLYPKAGAVQSVFLDRDGYLWCSIENEGVFKMDKQGNIVEHLNIGTHNFFTVEQDKAGDLWFSGKYSGLFQVNTKTGKITEHLSLKGKNFDIKSIKEDACGNLYISVFGKGFIRYNPATHELKTFVNIPNKNSVSNDWIYKFIIDSQGLVWLGHFNGVDCYNPETGRFTLYSLPGINKYVTYSLIEDSKGNIWAGTNQGLVCFHRQTNEVEIFQEKDGLSNNVVYALVEDKQGNIWCSTLKGISKLQVCNKKFYLYNTGREMIDNEYASNAPVAISSDGTVFFGGTQGITVFHPDSLSASKPKQVILSAIYLNGKRTSTKEIKLSFYNNTLTLEFTTFTYDDPANTFYEYRLKGKEEKWNATRPGINQITYNHLPPGHFTIEARACRNGIYSDILPISVRISPPWWQSAGAYILYTVIALFVLLQIYFNIKRKHQQEMNEEKIKLFVNLSHEIRSPMTLIMNPLDTMLKKEYDEDTLRMLRLMKKNANRIIDLINQLLDMRKIEKGRMSIKCREVDMIAYIKSLMDLFEYQAKKREIRLCFDSPSESMPAWIDAKNFDKALVNIITNALKYTPDGGIIKVLVQERIDKNVIGDLHHSIEIQVLDTGVGIDADKLEKIFERFYTTPSEGAMGGIGFGIGLNLCRLIVKLHHGVITACNREDTQGSCFTIRIPYGNMHLKKSELVEETALPSTLAASVNTTLADDEQIDGQKAKRQNGTDKILVVDDDEEILAYLFAELSHYYKVRTCNNGNDAWQIVLAEKPQLVISDVIMSGMNGYALLKQIKKNTNVSHIPVILLTSKTESEDRIKGIKCGADAYLNKPFNIDELKAVVANLLKANRRLKGKFSGTLAQEDRVENIEMRLKNDVLMERIMKVINKNMANTDLDVDFLAKEAGISRVHLHRKLKEMTGVPVATFIRNIRLQQAALLLRNQQQDVAQVGYAVGYDNQANFATIFKKQFGVVPSKYADSFHNQSLKTENEIDENV